VRKFLFIFIGLLIHGCSCTGVYAQTQTTTNQKYLEFMDSKVNFVVNPYARINAFGTTVSSAAISRSTSVKLFSSSSFACDIAHTQ
jgi:hypothetical protein